MKNQTVKNLLSVNKKALQFLHHANGFDFEKEFTIIEKNGKFAENAIKKEVDFASCEVAVLIVPNLKACFKDLHYAFFEGSTLRGTCKDGVKYWRYGIDYCFGVGDFNEFRKEKTDRIFIVAQKKEYLTPKKEAKKIDFLNRYHVFDFSFCGDGRGNRWVNKINLSNINGSGEKIEYSPFSSGYYPPETKSDILTDYVDKSGYLVRQKRHELKRRAIALKAKIARSEVVSHDFSKDINIIDTIIKQAKEEINKALLLVNDSKSAKALEKKTVAFSRGYYYYSLFLERLSNKDFLDMEQANNYLNTAKEYFQKIIG